MKSPEQQKEVRLFMERATQMLAVAEHNLAGDFYESSVNRSYYAVFYAASALLTTQEKSMSRHAGVISALKCTALVGTGRLVMNKLALPIQSLTNEEEMAVQQFIFELKQQFKDAIYAITLYGSKARGDALVDSDIDLLIVMDSDEWVIRNQVSHIASRVSLEFDLLLSPHVISKETWQEMLEAPLSFYKNIWVFGISWGLA